MTTLDDYQDKYENVAVRREDGVLQVTLHTDGSSLKWSEVVHRELPEAFADIGADRENRVVILTGAGDAFCAEVDFESWGDRGSIGMRDKIYWEGRRLQNNLMAIEVPIIGAVNGPAHQHAELLVLSDIVLAAEQASFRDPHFSHGRVPGDGVHVVWPMLLGLNRAKYFHLTGQVITAQEALVLGIVSEVLPSERLLERAWEHARTLSAKPNLLRRYTRVALNMSLHRRMQQDLGYGQVLEGLAAIEDHFIAEHGARP